MTKQEEVRQALAELGNDAKSTQIRGHVKQRFGIEMTTNHVSTAKGEILRKAGGKGKAVAKKAAAGKPRAPSAAPAKGGKAGVPLEDILAVKELVGRLGAEPLRTFIDALAQ